MRKFIRDTIYRHNGKSIFKKIYMAILINGKIYLKRWQKITAATVVSASALFSASFTQNIIIKSPNTTSSTPVALTSQTSSFSLKVTSSNSSKMKISISEKSSGSILTTITDPSSTDCRSSQAEISGLSSSSISQIRKLAEYNQVCKSSISNTLSYFVPIPTTESQSVDYAADLAVALKEFAKYKITPIIFLEPVSSDGDLVDMDKFSLGDYDHVIDSFFFNLSESGITNEMMGTWVPFPEANIPVWSSLDPNIFTNCVIKTINHQKKYFPNSKASLLLDTMTYQSIDSWDNAQAVSFEPYIKGIPEGLIDSFGLQGFPWLPPLDDLVSKGNGTPRDYLRVDLAIEAAKKLGLNSIWLNTGTFSTKYTHQPTAKITVTPKTRLDLLNQVVEEAKKIKSEGFDVSIHLFAEDKSATEEATDWSYWPSGKADKSPSTYVFQSFVHNIQAADINLWLFDSSA